MIRTSIALSTLLAVGVVTSGCEDSLETDPTPTTDGGGARSAYGKAQERAEKLEEEIEAYQQQVIDTADAVFDDDAARRLDGQTPPGG